MSAASLVEAGKRGRASVNSSEADRISGAQLVQLIVRLEQAELIFLFFSRGWSEVGSDRDLLGVPKEALPMENSRCCLRWIKASDARPLGTRAAICAASARLTAPLSENYRYGEERVAKRRKKVEDEVGWVMLEERLERWWRWKMRNMRKYAKREGVLTAIHTKHTGRRGEGEGGVRGV